MSDEKIRGAVLRALGGVAPEADLAGLDSTSNFREQIDLDSIDFTNFVIALADELGLEVPETDYPKLLTVDGCVTYLESRVESDAATP